MKGVTGETQLAKKVSEDRKSKGAIVEGGGTKREKNKVRTWRRWD